MSEPQPSMAIFKPFPPKSQGPGGEAALGIRRGRVVTVVPVAIFPSEADDDGRDSHENHCGSEEVTERSGDYVTSLPVSGTLPDEGNRALRYLWARSRIAELSDYGFGSPSEENVKAITALGLNYNLLTQYTSFIAVREKVVNAGGATDDINQPLPLPVGVNDLAVGSEPELAWVLVMCSLLFGLILLIRHRNRTRLVV